MRLTFLGADHEVTGSCHFLQACGKNILIDCGMEQGNDVYENQELPVPASDVDYVLLTHAHIDHSGLIPLLYVNGFRGKVYTTEPTVQLCEIMLKDSAHIQMFEAEWRNRKAKRSNGTLKEFVPQYTSDADYVVMESTYGNRSHGGTPDYVTELVSIFERTFNRGGNVVIPSFAVGRTQEILYFIRKIKQDHLIDREFDVYMDSPLAIEATNIFQKNVDMCFDEEAMALVKGGINPLTFPGLKFAVTGEESKLINFDPKPKVILSASGMCEAGRIRHHLKHNLWRPECTILFVGYQAVGTTGRIIVDGADEIKLFGEPIKISAEIVQLQGASGHADKEGLIRWVSQFEKKPKKVFVVHGEDSVCDEFTECLRTEHGFNAEAPYTGASYDLIAGEWLTEGNRKKKERRSVNKRNQGVFDRLIAAGKRLMTVIQHNEGGANKDLAKFADQINALCDKWDR